MVLIYFLIDFLWLFFPFFSGAWYVKCRAQRCTEGNRQYLFPGDVDTNSLVVQDEYVFTQVGVMIKDYVSKLKETSSVFHSWLWRQLFSSGFGLGVRFIPMLVFYTSYTRFSIKTPYIESFKHTWCPLVQCAFWLYFFSCLVCVCVCVRTHILKPYLKMGLLTGRTKPSSCKHTGFYPIFAQCDFESN